MTLDKFMPATNASSRAFRAHAERKQLTNLTLWQWVEAHESWLQR